MDKVRDQPGAIGRVHNLKMELHGIVAALFVSDGGERRILRHGDATEALRQFGDTIAVAHPHRIAATRLPHALEQGGGLRHLKLGAAELSMVARLDLATELHGHDLLAVTDTKHRHTGFEDRLRRTRRALIGHRAGAAGQDHCLGMQLREGAFGRLERRYFAINAGFTHPARDELGHLRAEVDDQHLVVVAENLGMDGVRAGHVSSFRKAPN